MVKVIQFARAPACARPVRLVARWVLAADGRTLVCRWEADARPWFAPVPSRAPRPAPAARARRLMPRLLARAA
jgi:hypothetical protein